MGYGGHEEFDLIRSADQGVPLSEMNPAVTVGAELMSVTEAATMLRLSRMTVLRRIKSGAWPGGRSGRKYLLYRPFAAALAAEIGSGRNVVAEDFAAAWMARNTPEAVA